MNDLLIGIMITFVVALVTGFAVARVWSGGPWEQMARDHNWWSFDDVTERLNSVRAERDDALLRAAAAESRTVEAQKDRKCASDTMAIACRRRDEFYDAVLQVWKLVTPNEPWTCCEQTVQRVKDLRDQATALMAAAHAGKLTPESIGMLATALGVALPQTGAGSSDSQVKHVGIPLQAGWWDPDMIAQQGAAIMATGIIDKEELRGMMAVPEAVPVVRRVATIINDTWQFGTVVGEVFITSNMLRVKMDDGSEIVRDATRCQSVVPF